MTATMGYAYDSLGDLNFHNVGKIVEQEAISFAGEHHFRGKTYDQWYELAYDAYESWYQGDDWGRLFEKIGEKLEELEASYDVTLSEDLD